MAPHHESTELQPKDGQTLERLERQEDAFDGGGSASENRRVAICVLADVHLGSLFFDWPAFEECTRMLRDYLEQNATTRISHLVLLGETVDEGACLPGQALRGLTAEWQVDLAAKLVLEFAHGIQAEHVAVVGKKGEVRRGPSQQRRLAEKLLLAGVKADHSTTELKLRLGAQQVVFSHALGRTSGSYAGVLTPHLLTEGLIKADRLSADLIVVGNYRRFAHSAGILSMPSFLLEPSSEIYNERGVALLLESGDGVEVKMFQSKATMDYEKLTATNLASISTLLEQIYPYSLKARTDGGATKPSQQHPTTSRLLRNSDDERSLGGYVQVHTQLPTRLASELQAALTTLGYGNTTEWIRDMARKTVHEAAVQIG